jgi:hypothetical protein
MGVGREIACAGSPGPQQTPSWVTMLRVCVPLCVHSGQAEGAVTCALCPRGRYGGAPGLPSALCSGPCAPGFLCPSGSVSDTQVECPQGWFCPSTCCHCLLVAVSDTSPGLPSPSAPHTPHPHTPTPPHPHTPHPTNHVNARTWLACGRRHGRGFGDAGEAGEAVECPNGTTSLPGAVVGPPHALLTPCRGPFHNQAQPTGTRACCGLPPCECGETGSAGLLPSATRGTVGLPCSCCWWPRGEPPTPPPSPATDPRPPRGTLVLPPGDVAVTQLFRGLRHLFCGTRAPDA